MLLIKDTVTLFSSTIIVCNCGSSLVMIKNKLKRYARLTYSRSIWELLLNYLVTRLTNCGLHYMNFYVGSFFTESFFVANLPVELQIDN